MAFVYVNAFQFSWQADTIQRFIYQAIVQNVLLSPLNSAVQNGCVQNSAIQNSAVQIAPLQRRCN